MTNVSWVGQTLTGRYHIQELLGHGGMSSVYKADDPNLHRTVAIKIIHPHLSSNPDFLSRFEEEAAMVAQLRHENIVEVYDFNHEGDVYYMVLEYLPGETLEDRLKRLNEKNRKMDPAEAVNDIAQVCDAVHYAHQKGLIHRDIKPANIMLDVYGKAVLMDFGIARMVGGRMHTAAGAVVGTAMYMSPEQIRGEKVDERSDIYSLGVTLFETVSGKPPFEADSAMTLMMMHLNDPVPNIRDLQPHVPESLVSVIDRAMEKKRENRYQAADEMATALRGVINRLASEGIRPPLSRNREVLQTLVEPPLDQTYVEQPVPLLSHAPQVSARPVEPPPARTAPQAAPYFIPPDPAQRPVTPGPAVPQPVPTPAGPLPANPGTSLRRAPLFIGGGLLLALVFIAAILYSGFSLLRGGANIPVLVPLTGGAQNPAAVQTAIANPGAAVQTLVSTPIPPVDAGALQNLAQTLTAVVPTTLAVLGTPLVEPTAAPTLPAAAGQPATAVPPAAVTSTINPDREYVRITNITIQDGRYVVDYETFGFTEALPGTDIHFFFNTVPPDQAGVPGKGPWVFFGGPRPFKGYAVANRPPAATQMCALVANADHTVQPQSGNCFNLPNP